MTPIFADGGSDSLDPPYMILFCQILLSFSHIRLRMSLMLLTILPISLSKFLIMDYEQIFDFLNKTPHSLSEMGSQLSLPIFSPTWVRGYIVRLTQKANGESQF
jgi:hypothetical protein